MAEYNFWDDRTTETNDDNYCPIGNDYCLSHDCDNCSDNIEFARYFAESELHSIERLRKSIESIRKKVVD